MKITISKDASKGLRRLPHNVAARIQFKIKQYAQRPASLANNVTKLQGRNGFRLRVGDYRVIFEIVGQSMHVLAVVPRGSIYD